MSDGRATRRDELENLDVLRALAVMLVLFGHMLATLRIRGFGDLGHFGVLLFFVHTSLVLVMSMDRMKVARGRLYGTFAVRRIFRIYPLSICAVLVMYALAAPAAPWSLGGGRSGVGALAANLLLVQNLTGHASNPCVLWSLPFEVQMYALLPLVFLCARGQGARCVLAVWGAGTVVAATELILRWSEPGEGLTRYIPCFLAGVVTWVTIGRRRPRWPGWIWPLVLIGLCSVYRFLDVVRVYGIDPATWLGSRGLRADGGTWWPVQLDLVRDWVFCALVALLIPKFRQVRARWLTIPGREIARYSYGIYLWHVPVLWIVFTRSGLSTGLGVPLVLLGTAALSVVSFHLLEQPAIRLGRDLANRWAARGAPVPARTAGVGSVPETVARHD